MLGLTSHSHHPHLTTDNSHRHTEIQHREGEELFRIKLLISPAAQQWAGRLVVVVVVVCVRWAGSEYRGLGERRRRLRPHLCDEIPSSRWCDTDTHTARLQAREAMVGISSAQLIDCDLWGFSSPQAGYGLSLSLSSGEEGGK